MKNFLLQILLLSAISGCATVGDQTKVFVNPKPEWPWALDGKVGLNDCQGPGGCSDSDVFASMRATGTYCRQVSNFYENGGNVNSNTRLGIKVLGVLAGSVFGITAGGSAAKAWSGLSGATNGVQSDLTDNAVNRSNRARVVSKVLADYNVEMKALLANDELTNKSRRLIVWSSMNTSNRCATEAEIEPESEAKKVQEQVAALEESIKKGEKGQQDKGDAGTGKQGEQGQDSNGKGQQAPGQSGQGTSPVVPTPPAADKSAQAQQLHRQIEELQAQLKQLTP